VICDGPTIRFGTTGFMVPALTSMPSAIWAAANFLASLSLVKDANGGNSIRFFLCPEYKLKRTRYSEAS
jgi:hypothetical protein